MKNKTSRRSESSPRINYLFLTRTRIKKQINKAVHFNYVDMASRIFAEGLRKACKDDLNEDKYRDAEKDENKVTRLSSFLLLLFPLSSHFLFFASS